MAHWNIFDQACGHVYDCTTEALSFDPRSDVAVSGGERMFKCFVSLNGGWGEFSQSGPAGLASGKVTLSCLFGTFTLKSLGVKSTAKTAKATVGGSAQAVTIADGVMTFTGGLTLKANSSIEITLSGGEADDIAIAIPPATADATSRERRPIDSSLADAVVQQPSCCPGGVCADGSTCPPGCCEPTQQFGKQVNASDAGLGPHQMLGSAGMAFVALLFFLLGSVFGPEVQALLARFVSSSR